MALGILGKKIGMTRIFDSGTASMIPVTVVSVGGNFLLRKKTKELDGYNALQVGFDDIRESKVTKALLGHFKKSSSVPKRLVKEFRFEGDLPDLDGDLKVQDIFEKGQFVDVIGKTKGKGFQGVVKRWNFGGLPKSHGSMMHRRPGSVGAGTTPGRIWKNKKMPGRHGNYNRTVQNLMVVDVLEDKQVILISGAVPGAKGTYLAIRHAKKKAHIKENKE